MNTSSPAIHPFSITQIHSQRRASAPSKSSPYERDIAFNVKKGELISIIEPLGYSVECLTGLVWITHDCDARDIVLSPGERHVANSNARMLVQGFARSTVRFRLPQRESLAQKISGKLRAILRG